MHRKAVTAGSRRGNARWRTFLEYVAWISTVDTIIVVGAIVPFGKPLPVSQHVLLFGLILILFALPVVLMFGSGSLMRLVVRDRRKSTVKPTEIECQPRYYWPMEHYLQAFLSAVGGTIAGFVDVVDAQRLPPHWVLFPWCVAGLTLLGILTLRTFVFGSCIDHQHPRAWLAATWTRGAWDRLGDLLIAASLTFLIVTCSAMSWFVGSGDEFAVFCAWVMMFSLAPLGLMLAGRGARWAWRRQGRGRQTAHMD